MKELKDLLSNNSMQKELKQIKRSLLTDERFLQYIRKEKLQLNEEIVENSLMNLLTFNDYFFKCEGCPGLEHCRQEIRGHRPELTQDKNRLHLVYKPCHYEREYERKQAISNNIRAFYMPKSILNAGIETINIAHEGNLSRNQAINKVFSFAATYNGKSYQKGVYLYGPFGVGKTYILAAMANELAKKNIKVAFVYLPDLIRELKSAIGKNNLEGLMDEIKQVQVLVLDDIGAEMGTAWVRDEILGPLLQYRLLEELPTFFTSNKSLDDLITDYSRTNDGTVDKMKANRLGDRVKALATELFIDGKNYRY
jgi:primosomal protein DnaI